MMKQANARLLGAVLAALALAPAAHAAKADPCADYDRIKQMEKGAIDRAKDNEKAKTDRDAAVTDLSRKTDAEGKAKDAWSKAKDALDKANKQLELDKKDADDKNHKMSDANKKLEELKAKAAAKQQELASTTQQGQENAGVSAELTNLQSVEIPKAQQEYNTAKDEAAKAVQKAFDTEQDQKTKKTAHDKAKGEYDKAQTDTRTATKKKDDSNDKVQKSSKARESDLNDFLNEYRNKAVNAQRCPRYQPSELGISLTMTRWKTAKKLLGRLLDPRADNQRVLFGGGQPKIFSGKGGGDSDLIGGFGTGELSGKIRDNLLARYREAEEKNRKKQEAIDRKRKQIDDSPGFDPSLRNRVAVAA